MESAIFDPDSDYAIGVDIGGTKMNAGVVSSLGEVLFTVSLPTLAGQLNTADRVTQTIRKLLSEVQAVKPGFRYKGIGVGSAGQIDWSAGQVRSASELLPGYAGTPLKMLLQAQFQLPVTVDNDVNVLALTEKHLGAGKGVHHFLCVALGTGVGGAVVVDGHLVHGCWGAGGELGHLSVDWNGTPCLCGGKGCLEQYASGTNIARRMTERLAAAGMAPVSIDSREVFSRWQSGDPVAAEVMEETIAVLGSALASLVHIFNPELIIIGGGVAEAGDGFLNGIRREMAARTMPSMHDGVRIEKAYRGNWSGMIGAALQVWEYDESS
ncbi:ROK family protein [Paenibacillus aceris]|uniref:Glucokinase n=1 Tax=Paenibacillus aceris TaxID=869555 RepID=A0ABS4HSJ1_9BACL|nr:ROK family protein [Paenibacillus aceris]MBP1961597.1 glucokinase [Paenibacillus aceris]NHW37630.1 ROK family protein [Paenibacillus aceris]